MEEPDDLCYQESDEDGDYPPGFLLRIPVTSLERDRRAIFSGCLEIASWLGQEHCLLPTAPEVPEDSTDRDYARILESVYQGFQCYLILVVKYLNKVPTVEESFRSWNPFVHEPVRPTISALLYQFWERIKVIFERLVHLDVERVVSPAGSAYSKASQTDSSCLKVCASCTLAQLAVRQFIAIVQTQSNVFKLTDTHIQTTKRLMKDEIYWLTQWGAVNKWCRAIENDLSSVCRCAENAQRSYRSLVRYTKKRQQTRSRAVKEKMAFLNNRIKALRKNFKKEKMKTKMYKKSISIISLELNDKCSECSSADKMIQQYENMLQASKEEMHYLEEKCERSRKQMEELAILFEYKCGQLNEAQIEKRRLQEEYAKKFDETMSESKKKDNLLDIFRLKIAAQEDLMTQVTKEKASLNEKIKLNQINVVSVEKRFRKMCEANATLESLVAEKNNEVLQLNSKLKNAERQTEMSNAVVPFVKAVGDPAVDMRAQLTANEARIQLLKDDNAKLESTLKKIYLHRMKEKVYEL